MRLTLILEPAFEVEPIHITSYCLGDVEVKMFRVDEFTYVVTRIDRKTRVGKSILCLSYAHADYVMEGCIKQLEPWIN